MFELGWISDGDMEMLVDLHLLYIARSFGAFESFRAADDLFTFSNTGTRRRGGFTS